MLSVWQLTAQIKDLLEASFGSVWVAGEISNLARPQSGHCYLTLKDDQAQIPCAMWRNTAARVRFDLHDGLEVVCRGRIDVYAPRGSYQLIIESIEPKGMGGAWRDDSPDNVQAVHRRCNLQKGSRRLSPGQTL